MNIISNFLWIVNTVLQEIRTQKGFALAVFKTAFAELCGFELQYDKEKHPPPVMVTGGIDKLEKLWYNHAPNINGSTIP